MLQIQQINFPLILVLGTITFFVLVSAFFLIFNQYQRKRHIHLQEKKILESQFSQTLLQSQLEIQEQTFKNISQEIHDNIGQALTLAKLNLNTMPAASEEQQEKIKTTKELVSKAIVDLRDLSRSLNTDYIVDAGLQNAIQYELGLISKSSSIATHLQSAGEPYRMDKQKELILFRIVQEVLNNIIKHAAATTIHTEIAYLPGKLELTITDNGKGFALPDQQQENDQGLGLRNMHNRAKLIGASLSLSSTPGNGTTVKIELPNEADGVNSARS